MRSRLLIGLVLAVILGVQVAGLMLMGRPWICPCGSVKLWHGVIDSAETSQHLLDWYSATHVLHGILFFAGVRLILPRLAVRQLALIALAVEVGWELIENTPVIVERYRVQALARGYTGDSILNSLSDSAMAMFGLGLAAWLPIRITIGLVLAVEIGLAAIVRDNLTLNVLQLIHPVAAISAWQAGR
ncbi:DUF2585 domain-containing protein [Prosthecodimorpha staleyi]|uniref:DUF2585 domain-containing protein n=1 Tax=Prosthecodimorpha staleyi TaxID=2840188 RepID=UPI0021C49568|nr:DUF2585 domain-containing protein [Prosthecodimorpha staleyi]